MFTSLLFRPALGIVDLKNHVVDALGSLDTAITVTTAEDIGRLTAEILLAEPRIRNTVVYTAGDTIIYRHLADVLEGVVGRPLKRAESSVVELQEALAQAPHDVMSKYRSCLRRAGAWRGIENKPSTCNADSMSPALSMGTQEPTEFEPMQG